jgi:hypothetical protein
MIAPSVFSNVYLVALTGTLCECGSRSNDRHPKCSMIDCEEGK